MRPTLLAPVTPFLHALSTVISLKCNNHTDTLHDMGFYNKHLALRQAYTAAHS
jgi:hypothetical protein